MEYINSPEYIARKAKEQAEERAAMAAARAEADRLYAIQRAKYEAEQAAIAAAKRPLSEALDAAGIQLEFGGYYEGAWMRYRIGDGPVVNVEEGFSNFAED